MKRLTIAILLAASTQLGATCEETLHRYGTRPNAPTISVSEPALHKALITYTNECLDDGPLCERWLKVLYPDGTLYKYAVWTDRVELTLADGLYTLLPYHYDGGYRTYGEPVEWNQGDAR